MDAKKKHSILLTLRRDSTFKLLRSLVPGGKLDVEDITFDSLMKLLKSHSAKKQSHNPPRTPTCYHCGEPHLAIQCHHKDTVCWF